jgi:hypothetical protein
VKSGKQKAESRKRTDFGIRTSFGLRASAFGFLSLLLVGLPQRLLACAACYGQSDSALAKGMNWGILSLLGVVVVVLAGFSSFFVFIAKRSREGAEPSAQASRITNHESLKHE